MVEGEEVGGTEATTSITTTANDAATREIIRPDAKNDTEEASSSYAVISRHQQQQRRKPCNGTCGRTLTEDGYSITMWKRGPRKKRLCLSCSRLPPPPFSSSHPPISAASVAGSTKTTTTKTTTTTATVQGSGGGAGGRKRRAPSSSKSSTISTTVNGCASSSSMPPPKRRRRRRRGEDGGDRNHHRDGDGMSSSTNAAVLAASAINDDIDDDHLLPPDPPRPKNGMTPIDGRRVRSCMCRHPSVCRELTWRWARLGSSCDAGVGMMSTTMTRRMVDYVVLPKSTGGRVDTKVGRHVDGYRRVAYRGLGYEDEDDDNDDDNDDDEEEEADAVEKGGDEGVVASSYGRSGGTSTSDDSARVATMREDGEGANIGGGSEGASTTNNDDDDDDDDNDNTGIPRGDERKRTRRTTRRNKKYERIAMVHFHPSVIPYLLGDRAGGSDGVNAIIGIDDSAVAVPPPPPRGGRKKSDRWRIPLEVGDAIGMSADDICPDPDTNDVRTYYAIPNYDLETAIADVKRAEDAYKDNARRMHAEDDVLSQEAKFDPVSLVSRVRDMRRTNARLSNENSLLRERLRMDGATMAAMAANAIRMRRDIDRMERRLARLDRKGVRGEATTLVKGQRRSLLSSSSSSLNKGRNGTDIDYGGCGGKETNVASFESRDRGNVVAVKDGRGGRRWSDIRMDRAVEARWRDPSLSAEEALRIGGYLFPPSLSVGADGNWGSNGAQGGVVVDSENVSIAQRKNNLLRRLRLRRTSSSLAREGSR